MVPSPTVANKLEPDKGQDDGQRAPGRFVDEREPRVGGVLNTRSEEREVVIDR
jgi:hypothetical protein